jgi:hypothetical protein
LAEGIGSPLVELEQQALITAVQPITRSSPAAMAARLVTSEQVPEAVALIVQASALSTPHLGPDGVRSGPAAATALEIDWIRSAVGARLAQLELAIGSYFTVVQDNAAKTAEGVGRGAGPHGEGDAHNGPCTH